MNTLARETGAPALFGNVMNSDWRGRRGGRSRKRRVDDLSGAHGDGRDLGQGEEGLTVDDYFLEPSDAAARLSPGRGGRAHGGGRAPLARRPRTPTPWPKTCSSGSSTGLEWCPCYTPAPEHAVRESAGSVSGSALSREA